MDETLPVHIFAIQQKVEAVVSPGFGVEESTQVAHVSVLVLFYGRFGGNLVFVLTP